MRLNTRQTRLPRHLNMAQKSYAKTMFLTKNYCGSPRCLTTPRDDGLDYNVV